MDIADQAAIPREERLVGEAMRRQLDAVVDDGLIAGNGDLINRAIGLHCSCVSTRRGYAEISHESIEFVVVFMVRRHGQLKLMRDVLQSHLDIVSRRIAFVNRQSIMNDLGMRRQPATNAGDETTQQTNNWTTTHGYSNLNKIAKRIRPV